MADHLTEDQVTEAFKEFDLDGLGMISASRLTSVLTEHSERLTGKRLTEEEIAEFVSKADLDGDGRVNISDIASVVLSK
eukprot:CAMPEP_0204897266 /NCGR_PEP_ID=MMETSP1397-20131031/641_1 /ASSEMBLY_ACC=CAM_ASM_000891 /TAXON_ID=49980 /ORGANISM="Climacostomum Climacostomum virens, Strain Stock W-24" /LENGTH=78 /DNA_ID=CAMNT_0052064989 /DNA_START=6 /DNA_END=242 /DNA_ORIENTATION=+